MLSSAPLLLAFATPPELRVEVNLLPNATRDAAAAALLSLADMGGDGKLSFEEFKKAIVAARKQHEPTLVEDDECLCKVQSAFDFIDWQRDDQIDATELGALLEMGAKLADMAARAEGAEDNYARKRRLTYEIGTNPGDSWTKSASYAAFGVYYFDTIDQRTTGGPSPKGLFTTKPDPMSYVPKADKKMTDMEDVDYANWPLFKPRWPGQTREDRYWEVWGLAHGGRVVDANGNRIRPGNAERIERLGRGKVRGCDLEE